MKLGKSLAVIVLIIACVFAAHSQSGNAQLGLYYVASFPQQKLLNNKYPNCHGFGIQVMSKELGMPEWTMAFQFGGNFNYGWNDKRKGYSLSGTNPNSIPTPVYLRNSLLGVGANGRIVFPEGEWKPYIEFEAGLGNLSTLQVEKDGPDSQSNTSVWDGLFFSTIPGFGIQKTIASGIRFDARVNYVMGSITKYGPYQTATNKERKMMMNLVEVKPEFLQVRVGLVFELIPATRQHDEHNEFNPFPEQSPQPPIHSPNSPQSEIQNRNHPFLDAIFEGVINGLLDGIFNGSGKGSGGGKAPGRSGPSPRIPKS